MNGNSRKFQLQIRERFRKRRFKREDEKCRIERPTARPHRVEMERLGHQARLFAETFTWERAASETEAHLRGVAERGG